jgi:group I intron endonuclease
MAVTGVYEIKNISNNKRYVGSSTNIPSRFSQHRRMLANNNHHSAALQNAWNFHGESVFKFNILAIIELSELVDTEQRLLNQVFSEDDCYNSSKDATAPMRNRCHSLETKLQMSINRTGDKNSFYGMNHTKESRLAISASKKGSIAHNLGVESSIDTRNKISASKKGIVSPKKGLHLDFCKNGHAKTQDSIYLYKDTWHCKICRSEATLRFLIKKKENSLGSN